MKESPMKNQTNTRHLLAGLGGSGGMKKLTFAMALLWLFTIVASASIRNRISLLSGTLAGQAIGNGNYEITVAPGTNVLGSFDVLVHNEMPDAAIAPVAATTTWGTPQTSYWGITPWATTGDSTQHVNVNVTVPSD